MSRKKPLPLNSGVDAWIALSSASEMTKTRTVYADKLHTFLFATHPTPHETMPTISCFSPFLTSSGPPESERVMIIYEMLLIKVARAYLSHPVVVVDVDGRNKFVK